MSSLRCDHVHEKILRIVRRGCCSHVLQIDDAEDEWTFEKKFDFVQ